MKRMTIKETYASPISSTYELIMEDILCFSPTESGGNEGTGDEDYEI